MPFNIFWFHISALFSKEESLPVKRKKGKLTRRLLWAGRTKHPLPVTIFIEFELYHELHDKQVNTNVSWDWCKSLSFLTWVTKSSVLLQLLQSMKINCPDLLPCFISEKGFSLFWSGNKVMLVLGFQAQHQQWEDGKKLASPQVLSQY